MATLKSLSMCVVAVLLGVSAVAPAHAQPARAATWDARYDPTGESKNPTAVKVSIDAGRIAVVSKAGELVSVPVPSVTAVSYDTRSQRRTKEGAALMVASPIGGLILSRTKKTRHFVSIESATRSPLVLELGKEEYAPFLGVMRDATGLEWIDVSKARRATEEELGRVKNQAIEVRLDRAVVVNGVSLEKGQYRVVLLDRGGSAGELHFFAGKKVDPAASLVHVTVSVVPEGTGGKAADVTYGGSGANVAITEIKTPTLRLTLTT
jgi:hypothetical protein